MPKARREIPWLETRNGTYYVFWYSGERNRTERLSLRTSDAVEAQKRYAAFLAEGSALFNPDSLASGITVSQALDDYYREHTIKKNVAVGRTEIILRHLKAFFKNTPLKEIDIPSCRAYADARRAGIVGGNEKGERIVEASDATIRRELGALSAAANHARKWKRITLAEMPVVERPSEARRHALTDEDYLTVEEWRRALNAARDAVVRAGNRPKRAKFAQKLVDFMVVCYDTGSRRRAIERLTPFQVNLKTGRVNLRSPTETEAERNSRKRRGVVPIGDDARSTYERLLEENKDAKFLFGTDRSMYGHFRRHMESLGLGRKSNPHIIRHSRATHLLQAGVSIYDVARLLCDTVATVERVYGHHSPEFLGETLRKAKP